MSAVGISIPALELRVHARVSESAREVISPGALRFIAHLAHEFEDRRQLLLQQREARQQMFDAGILPDFFAETAHIRNSDWKIAAVPADLQDRRVEITGPVDRKMVINGLNSGASTYMADFEDSSAPAWDVMVEGQLNLRDAVRRTITFSNPSTGKDYRLNDQPSVLLIRPRGWHLNEQHVTLAGKAVSASLFDFGLYFYNNVYTLLARRSGPYLYLPKLEHYLEARLWNDVFVFAQEFLGVPRGTIKATVLLETFPAVFQMNEILFELREHSSGLNCGRWDYIFSYIKTLRAHAAFITPDRSQLTMTVPFMLSYVNLLISTCHRRGAHAMGGMAAQIPVKNDLQAHNRAMESVRSDKMREAISGHDGTWVAHPALVSLAREVFDQHMPGPNQIHVTKESTNVVMAAELMALPSGATVTAQGVRENCNALIQYVEAFVRGVGCIPVNNKMEDAATAEISRAQLWQWIHHEAQTTEGHLITKEYVRGLMCEEADALAQSFARTESPGSEESSRGGRNDSLCLAAHLCRQMVLSPDLHNFLTSYCYPYLVSLSAVPATESRL